MNVESAAETPTAASDRGAEEEGRAGSADARPMWHPIWLASPAQTIRAAGVSETGDDCPGRLGATSLAAVLADWRFTERMILALDPDSPDLAGLSATAERLRARYQELFVARTGRVALPRPRGTEATIRDPDELTAQDDGVSDHPARVQNAERVEGQLDRAHHSDHIRPDLVDEGRPAR